MQWAIFTIVALSSSMILVGPLLTVEQFADEVYSIMFDAGSTGTRLHIFSFGRNANGSIKLLNEDFDRISPGLSHFDRNPSEGANRLRPLLDKAKSIIPHRKWENTPVVLRATAGLRLLSLRSQNSLLEEVRKVFQEYPFKVSHDAVSVMDGVDEGIFSWLTLSFIKGQLFTKANNIVSLDLGGASTQITFAPSSIATVVTSPYDHIEEKRLAGKEYVLYTHSYLGKGLMSSRQAILDLSNSGNNLEQERYSSCIHPNASVEWLFNGIHQIVRGDSFRKYGFDSCYGFAVKFLNDTINRPAELKNKVLYAMSYYYDRAVDAGLLNEGATEGSLAIKDYFAAAKKECSTYNLDHPFLCLDLSYISALLHHGVGIEKRKKIKVIKKIQGLEISWALGAAFSLIK